MKETVETGANEQTPAAENIIWAKKELENLKQSSSDPHLKFINPDELSDTDLGTYHDFKNGYLSGEELEKLNRELDSKSANTSTQNLYAMMVNEYISDIYKNRKSA